MTHPTRLGAPGDLCFAPMVRPLGRDERFSLLTDTSGGNAVRLRERALDAALIGMIEYARDSSDWRILPGAAAAGGPDTVVIHFRAGLHTIRTLAVHPAHATEIVLARILLAEEFDVAPAIVPAVEDLDGMLRKADAALLVGDAAFHEASRHPNRLDLAELWRDVTGFPLVHGVWCAREGGVGADEVRAIAAAAEEGAARRAEFAASPEVQIHLDAFLYAWDDDVRGGFAEFLRYAYYHGVLPDVPELHLFGADDEAPETESGPAGSVPPAV